MRSKIHKTGDLVYAPQASLLHTGGTTIKLDEPALLLVASDESPVEPEGVSPFGDVWCPVVYEGRVWYALKKDLYEPRRKNGDKTR
jgi:hypothetical protein